MTQERILGIGIIGCGLAANDLHYPALDALKHRIRVRAVCNRSPRKAEDFAARLSKLYGEEVPWFQDFHELLKRDDVEAVSVILPVELNLPVTRAAVSAGKHVLIEKPIALSVTEAREMVALEATHPELVMMVAENFRYRPVYRELAAMLDRGDIGRPFFVEWNFLQDMRPETNQYAQTKWRIEHKFAGGFVTDGGVHWAAALRDVFGELKVTASSVDQVNPGIGRMDTMMLQFHSSGKGNIPAIPGQLKIGFSVQGLSDFSMRVFGSRGSLIVDGDQINLYRSDAETNPVNTFSYPDGEGYLEEYEDFYQAVINQSSPVSSFIQAQRDLEFIMQGIERGQ
ncbi:MAG: Gfo/Idh/MocA family protein [Spirochaeta sp.]